MYCPNCGSETSTTLCAVCGTNSATATSGTPASSTKGPIDSVTSLVLGSWWRRFGATFADGLVLILPLLIIESFFTSLAGELDGVLAGLVVQGLYMIKLTSSVRGQTIGNRVAHTRVRDASTGDQITNIQALKRWGFITVLTLPVISGVGAGFIVYLVLALVDNLWPLFDKRNQTLHDKVAKTIVVVAD